jgi:hypothetical protein
VGGPIRAVVLTSFRSKLFLARRSPTMRFRITGHDETSGTSVEPFLIEAADEQDARIQVAEQGITLDGICAADHEHDEGISLIPDGISPCPSCAGGAEHEQDGGISPPAPNQSSSLKLFGWLILLTFGLPLGAVALWRLWSWPLALLLIGAAFLWLVGSLKGMFTWRC